MDINEGAVRQLAVGQQFSRRQPRHHVWGIILKVGGVSKGPRPNIMLIVLWLTQVQVYHNRVISTYISIDTVFCNYIVMVASDPAVC